MGEVTQISSYKRKRRRAGNIRWVMCLLLLLVCLLAGYYFSQSSVFFVKEIIVSGNSIVDSARIADLTGIEKGVNTFKQNMRLAEQKVVLEPLIETVSVKRRLPGKVVVSVTERESAMIVAWNGSFLHVDKKGALLKQVRYLEGTGLPIISGVDDIKGDLLLGRAVSSEKITSVLRIIGEMDERSRSIVRELQVSNLQKVKFFTPEGLEVRIGDVKDFAAKFSVFDYIYKDQLENKKIDGIQYIDVSLKEKPVIYYYN